MERSFDVICIGGGIVGLATAYELARERLRVALLDKGRLGGCASWAGAGILSPPPSERTCRTPFDYLRHHSCQRMQQLAGELQESTGVDVGYRPSGAIEVALDEAAAEELDAASRIWQAQEVPFQRLTHDELRDGEPHLHVSAAAAYWLPQACQVRNPRLLKALVKACEQLGVELMPRRPAANIAEEGSETVRVELVDGTHLSANWAVVTAGAWTSSLLRPLHPGFETFPVKGQIVTFQTPPGTVRSIVHIGKRYFVPRADGLLLVGATEEAGVDDTEVTASAAGSLRGLATQTFPILQQCASGPMWAGRRPGSRPAGPIICPIGDNQRIWVATGHFRQGLQLSPGTARLITDAILKRPSFARPSDFACDADRESFQSGFHS